MELSTRPLSVAEPAFHSIAANYLSGSLLTNLSRSAICRTTTEASLYIPISMKAQADDWLPEYTYFWSEYLLKCQTERSESI